MERLLDLIKGINWQAIKDNWKQFIIISAFAGIISLSLAFAENVENNNTRINIINNWKDQLPEEHWVNEEFITENFVDFQFNMFNIVRFTWDDFVTTLGEQDEAGKFMATVLDVKDKIRKSKYILRFQDTNKKVRTIKVKEGEQVDLSFYKGEEQLVFNMTEDEFLKIKENNYFNNGKELVISCIEDTTIATIYDGTITAKKKGKTILFVLCDGYYWEYDIKVK